MEKIGNNIRKIVCIFLIVITMFSVPSFAAKTTIPKKEATTRSGASTSKEACLHYAKKIMGHNLLTLKSQQRATRSF